MRLLGTLGEKLFIPLDRRRTTGNAIERDDFGKDRSAFLAVCWDRAGSFGGLRRCYCS
jgi:hypothetical protein